MSSTNGTVEPRVGRGRAKSTLIRSHRDLEIYRRAVASAMEVFGASKKFPKEEIYSLTSQVRRSSRSVASNICEAWRKRRYEGAFVAKLSDAETEAAETQVHIEFGVKCGYLARAEGAVLYRSYENLIGSIITMMNQANRWTIAPKTH